MRPRYAKATKKDTENPKERRTGTGRGCDGTINLGGTRKPDNTHNGIRNPIPHDPDNPLKGIRDLVQNGNRSQIREGQPYQSRVNHKNID